MSECHFFVYGTLKRGQCREGCWPRTPITVQTAMTRGSLYDTGPYPALFSGEDWILGELWTFSESDFEIVSRELDVIEEYDPAGHDNLYVRQVVACWAMNDQKFHASIYLYAREQDRATFREMFPRLVVNGKKVVQWPERE